MKKSWIPPILGIIFILFVSGCVEGFDILNLFGPKETEAPIDILTVESMKVIPNEPIPADSDFTLTFYVWNRDEREVALNTKIYAYDWGRCNPTEIGTDVDECEGDENILCAAVGKTMYPEGTQLVEWAFETPTNQELGNIRGKCTIRFAIKYDFVGYTRADAIVASDSKIREAARAGESISVSPEIVKSRGPLKIDVDYGTMQPFRSGSNIPVTFRVENKGTGVYSEVPEGALTIKSPDTEIEFECFEFFPSYKRNTLTNDCEDKDCKIPLINKKSPPIRCQFEAPEVIDLKTFTIEVDLEYSYEIHEEEEVDVEPTFGVRTTTKPWECDNDADCTDSPYGDCTSASCTKNNCNYEKVCDGTECSIGSSDYCTHCPYPDKETDCDDGLDNDCNGFIDLDDPNCQEIIPEDCTDRIDNDGDGKIDCQDDSECPSPCDLQCQISNCSDQTFQWECQNVEDGTSCDDGNSCTENDNCSSGACEGTLNCTNCIESDDYCLYCQDHSGYCDNCDHCNDGIENCGETGIDEGDVCECNGTNRVLCSSTNKPDICESNACCTWFTGEKNGELIRVCLSKDCPEFTTKSDCEACTGCEWIVSS